MNVSADLASVGSRDVTFHDFESRAKAQDWNTLLQGV
jgi:hypothetical protein